MSDTPPAMLMIQGGRYTKGSNRHYPEEAPVREVDVGSFYLDTHQVTNEQFARFVTDTGYITDAERAPSGPAYEGVPPEMLVPGSLVFRIPESPGLEDWRQWWNYVPGANWRSPKGLDGDTPNPKSPVVHISYADAQAYACWVGKRLPSEIEWEFAARGGLDAAEFAWGNDEMPGGVRMANYWAGRFPLEYLGDTEAPGPTPVGSFPANPFGLYDMIGNVWEWTSSAFMVHANGPACCTGEKEPAGDPGGSATMMVLKGGSYLCARNYCYRYRPAARSAQSQDSSACHIGFRCAADF